MCVHVHAYFNTRAVSHWPKHKKECSKLGGSRSGSKQDRGKPRRLRRRKQRRGLGWGRKRLKGGNLQAEVLGGSGRLGRWAGYAVRAGWLGQSSKRVPCVIRHGALCLHALSRAKCWIARPLANARPRHHPHAHSRPWPATATTGRYCSKDCQRIHWKSGHKHECDDLKTLHDLQAEFAEMQGLDGFENYNPLHRPTLSDRFRVRD